MSVAGGGLDEQFPVTVGGRGPGDARFSRIYARVRGVAPYLNPTEALGSN